jgi:hypothetical protein
VESVNIPDDDSDSLTDEVEGLDEDNERETVRGADGMPIFSAEVGFNEDSDICSDSEDVPDSKRTTVSGSESEGEKSAERVKLPSTRPTLQRNGPVPCLNELPRAKNAGSELDRPSRIIDRDSLLARHRALFQAESGSGTILPHLEVTFISRF